MNVCLQCCWWMDGKRWNGKEALSFFFSSYTPLFLLLHQGLLPWLCPWLCFWFGKVNVSMFSTSGSRTVFSSISVRWCSGRMLKQISWALDWLTGICLFEDCTYMDPWLCTVSCAMLNGHILSWTEPCTRCSVWSCHALLAGEYGRSWIRCTPHRATGLLFLLAVYWKPHVDILLSAILLLIFDSHCSTLTNDAFDPYWFLSTCWPERFCEPEACSRFPVGRPPFPSECHFKHFCPI